MLHRRTVAERRIRPDPVLQWPAMRLRPLTEAECYARCYGGRREETVSVVRLERDDEGARADGGERGEAAEAREAA